MHRVSAFMYESEYRVQHILFIICKDVWVSYISASAECTASLSFVLVSVDPSVLCEAFYKRVSVFIPKRSYSFADKADGFFICMVGSTAFHHRHIAVPMMKFFLAEDFRLHSVIFMENRKCIMHRCYKRAVDR